VAFNNKKGSIPIRTDVDASKMDICAQAGVQALKDPSRQVANPDALITPDQVGSVQDAITKFWNNGQSIDDVTKALQAAVKS
jgi:glucose/mannose transport system substrate-binding protein